MDKNQKIIDKNYQDMEFEMKEKMNKTLTKKIRGMIIAESFMKKLREQNKERNLIKNR